MKKRVAFRSFVILLAAVMLLSSTSAYNILVYANQDSVANSLSAIGSISEDAVTEPTIAVQGGSLELEPNAEEESTEPSTVDWVGNGTEQNPYQISSLDHFMLVNKMIHETEVSGSTLVDSPTEKHFVLTADIDLTPLFTSDKLPYVDNAGNAYLISTDPSADPNKYLPNVLYIKLSGADNNASIKHKIYVDESVTVDVPNYQNFALFGYLGTNSVISDIVFENINVNVTTQSPQQISIISYHNEGEIRNCEIINSSITLATGASANGAGSDSARWGIAGAVADNRNHISGVKVENFTINLSASSANDYIGGLVARNSGTVQNSSISGFKFIISDNNHYIGGLVAHNTAIVTGCTVDMAGTGSVPMTNNISAGGYVGGLVGYNDTNATISNSSVTGTFTSAQSTSSTEYNICGRATSTNNDVAYFGGITSVNKGTVERSTVSDLGFYMAFASVAYYGYFGGIAAISSEGVVKTSVASGTFVAQNNTSCYAGGIIAYADSDDEKIVEDCYALFRLYIPSADLVGAVVGYGGNAQTAVNSYWSDAISGCVTSYVLKPNTINSVPRPSDIEPLLGKLNSENRAVTVAKNAQLTVNASELKHNFIKNGSSEYDVAVISAAEGVSLTANGTNNTIENYAYNARITFPSNSNGESSIGSSDKQGMLIAFNLNVFITSASGDPDSRTNPLVISSSVMGKFISQAPYGHYRLNTDIAITGDSYTWSKRYFYGSIDGNGNIISTDINLFKGIIGSRTTLPYIQNAITDPALDSESNLRKGVIKNLTIELSSDIETAIFGTVYDATFVNVSLTDGDPTPDDGDSTSYEGYVGRINTDFTALFINMATGNTYIYGCSTDVSVIMGSVNSVAAFIAYVSGAVVIDNCAVNSVGAYIGKDNRTNKAVFLAHNSENIDGYVINSIVSARVIGSGDCYVVMGKEHLTSGSLRYSNITWSKMNYASEEHSSDTLTSSISLWGSKDDTYSSIFKNVIASSNTAYEISIPQNVSAFENASISDFEISLISIDEANAELPYTGSDFTLSSATVENGKVILNVNTSSTATAGKSAWVKVFHYDTGMLTYVRFTVIVKSFAPGADGYYHISTPEDLIMFSEMTNKDDDYLNYAYKLDNSIDMSGYTYNPAASKQAFNGRFDGMGYTIKNLTIAGQGGEKPDVNVALIGMAVSDGADIMVNNDDVARGIYNLTIDSATVTSKDSSANTAVLVASSTTEKGTFPAINISNVTISNSSVVAGGKIAAAVLAHAINTSVNINDVHIENTSVQTTFSDIEMFINNDKNKNSTVGGLGGVIGTVTDNKVDSSAHNVTVTDITVKGLVLTGLLESEKSYAPVNVGAVVGTYQKFYMMSGYGIPKFIVGNAASANEFDIVVNDLMIMSTGITGGLIGSTNAQTTVSKAKISATNGNKSQILSKTHYFIGGIAGHIGSYDADGETDANAVANMYGVISDCLVENTEIIADNEAIKNDSTLLSRNVTVGGIVGAINGPSTGDTVKNCQVKDSIVEGVVVGGIVGSNIERSVISGNRIVIDGCKIISSDITTPENCKPVAVNYDENLTASFGVGGIIGTNRYSKISYAPEVYVTRCTVDSETKITNYTIYDSAHVYAATGGVMGFATSLYSDYASNGVCIHLSMNDVYAEIITTADMHINNYFDIYYQNIKASDFTAIRTGTGGILGMFGSIINDFGYTDANIAYFRGLSIDNSYFAGSVLSADCIGGIIGSVINTVSSFYDTYDFESYQYCSSKGEKSYIPDTPILNNIVISGRLDTFSSKNLIRGGIAIGHIVYQAEFGPYYISSYLPETIQLYSSDSAAGFISQIYYSSLEFDTEVFPFLGYLGLSWDVAELASNDGADYIYQYYFFPVSSLALQQQRASYTDVNKKADNATYQIANAGDNIISNASGKITIGSVAYPAPAQSRGIFSFGSTSAPSYWKTSNSSVVAVTDNAPYNNVIVTPKSKSENPVTVSIDYRGLLTSETDTSWSVPVSLPVGFKIISTANKVLDYVETTVEGETVRYYLISEPIDFNYIEANKNYWLKNDIVFDEALFETNGTFDGGYWNDDVFYGEFSSPTEAKEYRINGTDEVYVSDGKPKTITGLKFKPVSNGSYTASALFAYANGATFKNFKLVDVSSTGIADYAASVAAVVTNSLVAENIEVENANISGSSYSGGLFGGLFSGVVTNKRPVAWQISNCSLKGERTGSNESTVFSTNISGVNGAAGIVVHTDQKAAMITDIKVSGCAVSQKSTTVDTDYFNNGAAGVSLAFSGEVSQVEVENSKITGEIASGVINRTYSSVSSNGFVSGSVADSNIKAEYLTISGVDISDTYVLGTHSFVESIYINKTVSSAGILARLTYFADDENTRKHIISDCELDQSTVIEAPVGAGGILGCYEEGSSSDEIDDSLVYVSVSDCRVSATVKTTNLLAIENDTIYANVGVGGIIGSFSRNVGFTGTTVTNCIVDGTIIGSSAVGGIVGAIWSYTNSTSVQSMHFETMSDHFIENCIVSAKFKNAGSNDAFVSSNSTTGIVVGYVYDAAANDTYVFNSIDKSKLNSNNYPFYNIYYSGYKYPSKATYLFGVRNPGTNASQKSLNYLANGDKNAYACFTDYIYDMDFYTDKPVEINKTYHNIELSENYRIKQTLSEEDGIWVIDNRVLGSGKEIKFSDFTFNTEPVNGAQSDLTYRFDENASLNGFTLIDSAGTTDPSVAVLEEVKATSPLVSVTKISDGTYKLSRVSTLTKTLAFDLVFVYSNGIELVAPFRIEVSSNDYYFAPNGKNNGTDYFVFNAANLNSTLELTLGPNDRVIQCFDVFWTLDNSNVQTLVNNYTENTSLSEAYAGVTLSYGDGDTEEQKTLIELLKSAKHPNLEFDDTLPPSENNPENLSLGDYIGLKNSETLESVSLRRLVKEINTVSFGTYGKKEAFSLYETDFASEFTVLKSVTENKSTGLTEAGEYYSIYGLELHAINVSSQETDPTHSGLFKSLASGAEVTGLTFVNPRIQIVGSKTEDNYAGVLAGTANGAKINDVSVMRFNDGDLAYISSIRWMSPASTKVGALVGYADSTSTITNCSVDGIDVVGASLAGNNTNSLKTVMAGGIVGSSDAKLNNVSVENSRILVERNDRYRNFYMSYAGGIAAYVTGEINGAKVKNTVMRDCTCDVIVPSTENEKPYSTYSCTENALVADRIGGIVAFTNGSLTVSGAEVTGISIAAFDIAGGILAEVENNAEASVTLINSSVTDNSDIRIYSSANLASVTALRQYYNAVGGIVGKIDNLTSLNIDSCDFDGYVGTYSYDNLNKDCTAGGIIGFVTDKLTTLDSIRIYNSTVSGEVSGYRTNKTGNIVPYLGAAGGIIGKINTVKLRSSTENSMVYDCVMGAVVTLYNSAEGSTVNANPLDPLSTTTNVGKILGTLVESVTEGEGEGAKTTYSFALTEGNAKDASLNVFTKYFNNIYISSYPQDILAYGSKDFYGTQASPYATYTDINKVVVNTATGETTGALAIGGLDLTGNDAPEYTNDEYSELAIIPINTEQQVAGTATRGFRVKHNSITFGNGNKIAFEGTANIVAEADIKDATIDIKTGSDLANKNDGYYYGTLHIDNVTTDIIGEIVMDYSYGLQVNVQFIGMDIKGDGSSTNPFQVKEAKHFAVVRVLRDKNYIQTDNINFISQYSYSEVVTSPLWATLEGFEPIGTAKAPFIGSYNGQGYLLENLYISRANTDNVGLFGYVKGTAENPASISNVHIEIADKMSLSLNKDNLGEVTPVQGNVTGNNNVGGLVGSAVNAVITNCSVVKGNVIGSSAVGGLIGNVKATDIVSGFTSTTSFAHFDLGYESSSAKTAGGLVGIVSGSSKVNNSFTLGYAGLDPSGSGYNYGAVGSLAGYVDSGVLLEIDNAFVGAGVSDSYGNRSNNVIYHGITVGAAGDNATVKASNVFISATVAEGEYASDGVVTEKLNPILGTSSGATIVENVSFDSGLNGTLPNRVGIKEDKSNNVVATQEQLAKPAAFGVDVVICAETPEANKAENKSYIEIGVNADTDPYTAAYVEFAGVQIKVSDVETTDRMATSQASATESTKYQLGGLFYPITVVGQDLSVTSSLIDDADDMDYPAGMDTNLYGNGENKKTDLLFKNTEEGIKVYTNIFVFVDKVGNYTGKVYDNGEMFYKNSLPYFTVEKTETINGAQCELYRKVTYPIQQKFEGSNRVYPIATERQLNALAKIETEGMFSEFDLSKNYAIIENITLGNYEGRDYNYKSIVGFTGVLDGKGHTVSNIRINQPGEDKVGFFSELTKANIKNLHLQVASIEGNNYVGGLVGYVGATGNGLSDVNITNCSVSDYNGSGIVKGSRDYVGGLVGYAVAGGVSNGAATAGIFDSSTDVTVNGTNIVGGLVGCSEMYISNCYSTGDVNASINGSKHSKVVVSNGTPKTEEMDVPRGIGGLVGVLASSNVTGAYKKSNENAKALLNSSFSSSTVDVGSVSGYNNLGNGVGGLVGNVASDTSIETVFSSGSVQFCYGDGIDIENMNLPACDNTPALGVGGLVGVLNSGLENVYSAASVAANVGQLVEDEIDASGKVTDRGSVVGIGGLVGVSNAQIQSAYSSGSTLGKSVTPITKENADKYNYGVGGVVGLISSSIAKASNLFYDINVSTVSKEAIGKYNPNAELKNVGFKTTEEFISFTSSDVTTQLGLGFGATTGAYPYLLNFFAEGVSDVIRLNALLSIVAVEIDERDTSAKDGNGVSMAMTVPTYVKYGDTYYFYGFKAEESSAENTDYAQSLVDSKSNTLSFQRTSNEMQQANFTVVIEKVGTKVGENTDKTPIIEYDGVDYSSVASRPFIRVTADMLGTQDKPFLIASQTDLEHVAMSIEELSRAQGLYKEWNAPIVKDEEGNLIPGKVYYRLMGYFNLNEVTEYDRNFSTLDNGYSFDGNGYSIRNLSTTLAETLATGSIIKNVTFENVAFESDESLIGTLNGSVVGVNVYGTATGSKVAGIADTVGESTVENGNVISGLVKGCISKLNYSGTNGADFAGLVLENNGTIEMSTSVGSISGKNLTNVNALVGTNNGTIKNSFTMGDIILDNPAGVVSGFVGTNTGKVEACYTRCNFKVSNADTSVDQTSNVPKLVIGSFAGKNTSLSLEKIASIVSSFAAGLFEVRQPEKDIENPETQAIEKLAYPVKLDSIFVAQNSGELKDVMFDKQLSGTCFKDIFTYAESTSDIATLANHKALAGENGAYLLATKVVGESTVLKADEYPQLSAILATADSNDEVTVRMYRALRSYSLLSTATSFVANDNYIDNVPLKTKVGETEDYTVTPLTAGKMSWSISGNAETSGTALKTKAVGDAVATATLAIEDFYNVGASAKLSDTLNLYFVIDDDGANPNFAGGDGSANSKYQISEPKHVIALSYYGKNSSSYFEVMNDINMSNANWNNSYINIFKANLDGNGKVISNVEIPENGSNAFIGSLDGGSISNLGLTGITVTTSTTGASAMLAAKALNNASVTNCVVFGELNAPTGENVGGLFGETDGETVIDGCIVSGKINSGAKYVGGIVGLAMSGTEITNCLSTALVIGGDNTTATGGILASGTATVTNSIFAGNVKGGTAGNIAGESENVTVTNSYYDKQLSTVDGGATASTTHYLTGGAKVTDFGEDMVWITGFAGYPVPAYFASASGAMLNAVKLASAKVTFATGVGAGTSTTFITAIPETVSYKASNESTVSAKLGSNGKAATYITVANGQWKTNTNDLKLDEVCAGELTYALDGMTRYIDVEIGKQIQTVNYNITGLNSGSKSIISAITGNGGSATAATAFDTALSGVLCNDMVFTYDIVDKKISEDKTVKMAQLFKVDTQLPNGYKVNSVTVECADNGTTIYDTSDVLVEIGDDGFAYVYIPVSEGNDGTLFNTINIVVNATAITDTWGVRNLFGLFR